MSRESLERIVANKVNKHLSNRPESLSEADLDLIVQNVVTMTLSTDVDKRIGEIVAIVSDGIYHDRIDRKYTVSYSPRRGEVHVYNLDGDLEFLLSYEDLEGYDKEKIASFSSINLRDWVERNYKDVLLILDLLDYPTY